MFWNHIPNPEEKLNQMRIKSQFEFGEFFPGHFKILFDKKISPFW